MVLSGMGRRAAHSAARLVDVLEAVIAGTDEVLSNALIQKSPAAGAAPQTAEMKGRPVRMRHSWARSW